MAKSQGRDRLPERWRWLRPMIMSALVEAGTALQMGASPDDAINYGITALATAVGAMGIHGIHKEAKKNDA